MQVNNRFHKFLQLIYKHQRMRLKVINLGLKHTDGTTLKPGTTAQNQPGKTPTQTPSTANNTTKAAVGKDGKPLANAPSTNTLN